MEEVVFPVISFYEGRSMIYYFDSKKEFHYTSEEILKKGLFKNVQLIDSNGQGHKIQAVEKTGYRGLWGFHPLLKGTSIKVKYTLEKTKQYAFEEIKQFIFEKLNVRGSRILWGRTRKVLLDRLEAASTIKELLAVVE
ncbi:hypothetical protein [Spirosoma jeollabukense]